MNLSALKQADRKRLRRRAVVPEDGLDAGAKAEAGRLPGEILIVLFAGGLAGGVGFGLFSIIGRASGSWQAGGSVPVLAFFALGWALAGYGVFGKSIKGSKARSGAKADIASGDVNEITFPVSAAKVFRDPEHGSVAYFLKLEDGRVFFDMFGSDAGEQGWEKSPAAIPDEQLPGSILHLIFGTVTGELLATRMSGARIKPDGVSIFKGTPEYWPSPGTFRKTAWDEIEKHFGAKGP